MNKRGSCLMSDSRELWIRDMRFLIGVFAIASVTLSIPWVFQLAYDKWFVDESFAIKTFESDETSRLAIENFFETGRALLQASLTLIAATWGVVAIQKDHSQIFLKEKLTRCVFGAGTMCLCLSCYSYVRFSYNITYYLQRYPEKKSMPDLTSTAIIGYLNSQIVGIVCGSLCIALTVIAATWFKKPSEGN